MKIISDFDDVIFNTKALKDIIFTTLKHVGVSSEVSEKRYQEFRNTDKPFSLKEFLGTFTLEDALTLELYDAIMEHCNELVNQEVLAQVKRMGDDNLYIVTNGDNEFQKDKIRKSIGPFIRNVFIVGGTKKDAVEKICAQFPQEVIIFIDDKNRFFEDLDFEKFPNLKKFLYDETKLGTLRERITQLEVEDKELRKKFESGGGQGSMPMH